MEFYRPRSIRFMGIWTPGSWRVKQYGISYRRRAPRPPLLEAGRRAARESLAGPARGTEHYGLGFLGVHEGRDADVVFVDWWAAENELHHHLFVAPPGRPGEMRPRREGELTACVWDLQVMAFEREAWVRSVLTHADSPRWEDYLDDVLSIGPGEDP